MQIDNYYYQEIRIPDLEAIDSEDNRLFFTLRDYYDDLESIPFYDGTLSSVIPAGTSVYATYLLEIPDYSIDTIDSITVYSFSEHLMYDSEEKEYENGRRLTAPFTP